jgi:hypothetical protein
MILLVYYSRLVYLTQSIDERLRNNAMSGIQYGMSERERLSFGTMRTVDLFGDETDTTEVVRRPWGIFELISVTARHYGHSNTRSALITALADEYGKASVYAPENNAPIYLVGTAAIFGEAYLPERKLSTGYINGKEYKGGKLIRGPIHVSKPEILKLDTLLLDAIESLEKREESNYRLKLLDELLPNDVRSFQPQEANYFYDNGRVSISYSLVGNLIIHSGEKISIQSEAKLSDIILIAPEIDIEKGFEGSIQCFATRSITVGADCKLKYPSALVLLNGTDSLIVIRKNALVEGYVVIPGTDQSLAGRSTFRLEKGATLHGMAYVNAAADIQGDLWGHMMAKIFMASSGTGRYSNHILDGNLNSEKRSPYFPGTLLWAHTKELTVAKWLD